MRSIVPAPFMPGAGVVLLPGAIFRAPVVPAPEGIVLVLLPGVRGIVEPDGMVELDGIVLDDGLAPGIVELGGVDEVGGIELRGASGIVLDVVGIPGVRVVVVPGIVESFGVVDIGGVDGRDGGAGAVVVCAISEVGTASVSAANELRRTFLIGKSPITFILLCQRPVSEPGSTRPAGAGLARPADVP